MRRTLEGLLRSLRASSSRCAPNQNQQVQLQRGFADDASLLKTPLYDFHVEHGGEGAAYE
jgi:hypothetical protein